MKTITTVLDEKVTLKGNEWFVVMTDNFLSGWGLAEGKIAKRVVICKNHCDAEMMHDRLFNPKYRMSRVNVTPRLPKYSPSRYTVSYELDDGNLYRY